MEPEDYWPAVIAWIREHHGWDTKREWFSYIPGVVKGIGFVEMDESDIVRHRLVTRIVKAYERHDKSREP